MATARPKEREVDVLTLQGLGEILRADAPLWADFRRAVQDFRASLLWTKLLEHVYEVGNLEGKGKLLGPGLWCPSAEDRRRLAAHQNCLDGEIGFCRELVHARARVFVQHLPLDSEYEGL
jgi:hypothetical protein